MRIFKNNLRSALMLAVAFVYTGTVAPKSLTTTTQPPVAQPSVALAPAEQEDLGKKRVGLVREESLARVQKEQERRAGIDTRSLQEVQEATGPNRFTQTEAYFQLPKLRQSVTQEYKASYAVVRNMDIVSRVMAKEAEFRNTHWAFYHGTVNTWTVWQDTLTKLFNHFNPSTSSRDGEFIFLRTKGSKNIKVKEFLAKQLRAHGLIDDQGEDKGLLLSTNVSLFGNTGFKGEATWRYFMQEASHTEPERANYEAIMDEFGLPYTHIDELMNLVKTLRSKHETLLQIFVPKNIADDVAYLSWVMGVPARDEIIDWVRTNVRKKRYKSGRDKEGVKKTGEMHALIALKDTFKKEQEKNPEFRAMLEDIEKGEYSIDAYLRSYCDNPWKVEGINYAQARLLLTDDVLLNPDSGVKIMRYNDINYKSMEKYEENLDSIIQKIIAEKKK